MIGPITILLFVLAVIAAAMAFAPTCAPGDHSGPRIAGAVMIAGCR